MKKLLSNIALLFLTVNLFSQYFVPFGEDSVYHNSGAAPTVKTIYVDDTVLYIGGGGIEFAGTQQINEIGLWDNNDWYSLDNGFGSLSGEVYCFMKYKNNLYIGGSFQDIQNIPQTEEIGRYNGTSWEAVPNSYGDINSIVYDMVVHDNQLIVGGGFSGIGTTPLNFYYVAAYNDTDYVNIGSMPAPCRTLEVYNGELYYGGLWYTVKKYIGNQQWEDVGGYFNDYIYDMTVDTFNNFLYVCGGFNIVDDTIATDNVACWDGFKWSRVGYGTGETNLRTAIALYRGDLYVNSNIDTIGGFYTGYFMKWDGISWSEGVPGGLQFGSLALDVFDDMLYIGGRGPISGSQYCPMDTAKKTLARWYLPPATNCNYLKPRVQTYADTFYIASGEAQVQFYNNNAYVDTWNWDFGDTGTDTVKDPLHIYTDTGTYSVEVIVTHGSCVKTAFKDITIAWHVGVSEFETQEIGFKLYPNPTSNTLFVEIKNNELKANNELLRIIDINGKEVRNLKIDSDKLSIDISDLANGVYFVRIGEQTEKFVKE